MDEIQKNKKKLCIFLPLIIGLITPSCVLFSVQVFVGHVPPFAAMIDIIEKQFASGHNLFLLAAIGLIPFCVLSLILFHHYKNPSSCFKVACTICISGLIGILTLMIPSHASVWYPLYGPVKMSSTAAIAFLFIPFYCLVTMTIGLLLGRLVTKLYKKSS